MYITSNWNGNILDFKGKIILWYYKCGRIVKSLYVISGNSCLEVTEF
jgi:hypothetical protein